MNKWVKGLIKSNLEIAPGIFKMVLLAESISNNGYPGQFINLYCNSKELLLPRPISICEINKDAGTVTLVYAILGKGTNHISKMKANDEINVLGPLGKGFDLNHNIGEAIIVGGGIGIPPLLEVVKQLKVKSKIFLGYRSNTFLVEEFKKYSNEVYVATEDGSSGTKGNVMNLLNQSNITGNIAYSCGPKAMLRAVYDWSKEKDIPTQLSFEERMACGIGACLVCSCKTKKEDKSDWEYSRVCKDGPVFNGDEVIWDD